MHSRHVGVRHVTTNPLTGSVVIGYRSAEVCAAALLEQLTLILGSPSQPQQLGPRASAFAISPNKWLARSSSPLLNPRSKGAQCEDQRSLATIIEEGRLLSTGAEGCIVVSGVLPGSGRPLPSRRLIARTGVRSERC